MEKKAPIKISLPIFIAIIVILVAVVFSIYMNIQNKKLEKEIANLREEITQSQATKNELQEKLNSISNIANANSNETNKNESTSNDYFTDEQVKECLSNYLEIRACMNCDSLLEKLTEKGKLKYDSAKDKIQNDGTVITNIKFTDYKNAMLNYISEKEFENNWAEKNHYKKNGDGNLTKVQGGGDLRVYTIKNVTKNNNSSYTAKTTSVVDNNEYYEENTFNFSINSYNGKCVIDSINKK